MSIFEAAALFAVAYPARSFFAKIRRYRMKRFSRKKFLVLSSILILMIVLAGFWTAAAWPGQENTAAPVPVFSRLLPSPAARETAILPLVKVGETIIPVEVRRTSAELQTGLSGRPALPASAGMLFVFKTPALHSFWMPNRNFPIDIVWITGGRVVGIVRATSNDFDPDHPVYYRPPVPVEYVLEVNAGFMAARGLAVGAAVEFKNL